MNETKIQTVIRLLEEIRDGQRLQLERQAEALKNQAEALSQQRERLAGLSKHTGEAQGIEDRAERVLTKSAQLVAGARILLFIALPTVILVLAFVIWVLFAHIAG